METVAAPAVAPVEVAPPAPETVAAPAVQPATETVATSAAPAPETVAAPAVEPPPEVPGVPAAPETVATSAVPSAPETIAAPAVPPATETVATPAVAPHEPETPPTVAMPAARRRRQSQREQDWLASGGQSEPFARPATAPAAATAAPAPPLRAEAARRGRFPILAAVAALVVAAAVGYVVGKPAEDEPAPPAQPRLANSASTSALALGFPSTWSRRGEAADIPGLELKDSATVGPSGRNARGVTAGMADASGPRLLPAAFVKRLDEPPRPGDRVQLGKLQAFRYEGLEPRGFDRSLTLFTAPTSAGVATVACFAEAGRGAAFRADCERVAGSLELTSGTPFPLAADPKYAQALNREIAALDARRRAARTALARANRPAGQATAARALASAYSAARAKVGDLKVSPAAARANAGLASALGATSAAYGDLAAAARGSNRRGYRRAAGAVRRAERNVQARLQALKALGYTVG